ncbi:MAG: hypothetical protein H0X04_05160 [Chthoniobacterales bacterium]|jgi:hypothetical protein|nr:hypothetical protein [Chthoniobacterales bacterium]
MDEFGYLSVLLSIIIGLAVTEVLQGLRRRMLSHAAVKGYWPTQVWAGVLLLVCTQTWWAMFDLRDRHDWEFEQFLVLLTQTVLLYLAAGLVFPEFGGTDAIDLRAHYFRQRKRFFGLLLGATVTSIYRDWTLDHALPERTNLAFHLVFIAFAASGIVLAREWYHKFLAVFTALGFLFYITSLFTRLH